MENYQIQQEIKMDFATPDGPTRVYAKQYDNNMRIVKVNLLVNGLPYTVQSGFEVNVRMAKPDGTYVYNPALEISDTYVLIVLTQQMLAVAGECPAEIEVVQGGNVLSTATFVICVARDTVPEDAIESTDELTLTLSTPYRKTLRPSKTPRSRRRPPQTAPSWPKAGL